MESKWVFNSPTGTTPPSFFNKHEKGFWIVFCPGMVEPTKRYSTSEEARDVAKTIAELHPGKEVFVFRVDSCFAIETVKAVSYQ